MDHVRLGIIGLGAEGGMYAEFLKEGKVDRMTLGAICDIDPAKKELAAEKYPDVPFFDHYIDMLDSGTVDAAVTTVPHYLHPEMGINILERGLHALVEKPAGVYTRQVKELNTKAEAIPEQTFAIFFNQRMNPLYQKVKAWIEAGSIGELLRTNWIITTWWRPQGYYDQSAWRATWGGEGGGVLVNQAPHQLDLLQWLCGVPKSVFAKCNYGFQRDIVVEDDVQFLMDYGNGATGFFQTCTHDINGTDRLEIVGTAGKIIVENSKVATLYKLKQPEHEYSDNMNMDDVRKIFMGGGAGEMWTTEVYDEVEPHGQQHIKVLENFTANVLDGTPLVAPGSDGINGVRLANAVHLSSWLGREVPLDFDEDLYLTELNKRIEAEGKYPVRES